MTLPEWIASQPRGAMTRLSHRTGVAYSTIHAAAKGAKIRRQATAEALCAATEGAVTLAELYEPPGSSEPESTESQPPAA